MEAINNITKMCKPLVAYLYSIGSRLYNFFHAPLNWAQNLSCS